MIQHYFSQLGRPHASVAVGVGDDCALLTPPDDHSLALSIDTLVEGVHFPATIDPADLGYRALAVSLSDLAAAGADPAAFTLALTLPEVNSEWLAGFAKGMAELANSAGVALIGGDTTRGPLSITVQVHGWVKRGQMLMRNGAHPGDDIYLSGTVGDAAAALAYLDADNPTRHQRHLLSRYYRPEPRLALGQALRQIASAALDVSDGVLGDLGHICERSSVGAEIWADALPLSPALLASVEPKRALECALAGGDDYELCFTAMPIQRGPLAHLADELGIALTRIGEIVEGRSVRCHAADGHPMTVNLTGYQHFNG